MDTSAELSGMGPGAPSRTLNRAAMFEENDDEEEEQSDSYLEGDDEGSAEELEDSGSLSPIGADDPGAYPNPDEVRGRH